MKISICIPVYNFDVRNLVFDLKKEIVEKQLDAEIILIDDASEKSFVEINKPLQNEVSHFIFLNQNIGRSAIRNLFLKYANGDYFLFLDCDCAIIDNDFLEKYFDFLNENAEAKVVYGGRIVDEKKPLQEFLLRWKFATERENLSVSDRLKNPYKSFQTNNFLISKKVFSKIKFDKNLKKYGYEDLLFAAELKSTGVSINQVDNPVLNNDLETNDLYLAKVNESVENIAELLKQNNPFLDEIKLIKIYRKINHLNLVSVVAKIFKLKKVSLEKNLRSGKSSLRILDLYKLGLLCALMKKS